MMYGKVVKHWEGLGGEAVEPPLLVLWRPGSTIVLMVFILSSYGSGEHIAPQWSALCQGSVAPEMFWGGNLTVKMDAILYS